MNFKSARFVLGIASSAVALAFVAGGAYAVTDTVFKYTSPKTGYYGITNLALAANSSSANFSNSDGMGLFTSGSPACFSTGVNLPQGATIKTLVVYYFGQDENDVDITLSRITRGGGSVEPIGFFNSVDASGLRKSASVPITADLAGVNNAHYDYAFTACIDPGGNFFGARISYEYTNAGD